MTVDRKRLRDLALAVLADQALVQASDDMAVWAEPTLVSQWSVATSPTRILELLDALDAAEQPTDDARDATRYRHLKRNALIDWQPDDGVALVIPEPDTGRNWKADTDATIDRAIVEQAKGRTP